jgi:[ribosomal protein S5]-alanine N-acetyltransferase
MSPRCSIPLNVPSSRQWSDGPSGDSKQRLVLRPWTRNDVDTLHALWISPEVRRYLWDDVIITRDVAERLVDSHIATADQHGIGYWALHVLPVSSAEAPVAGFCGFRFVDDGPEIELVYGLRAEHWAKGFATEACLAAIEYLWRWTEFELVYARTDPPNQSSVRVMRRLGMAHQSTTPSAITYLLRRPI